MCVLCSGWKARPCVQWCCYETSAEACHAVTLLDLNGTDVIAMLQQRYFAEDSDIVRG